MRTIHINNKEWKYKVGRRCVEIRSPLSKKVVVSIETLLDLDYQMDENTKIAVFPSDIKSFIVKHTQIFS